MSNSIASRNSRRMSRARRIQAQGTAERPRLTVFRSLNTISAQLIDDVNGVTLVSANSKKDLDKSVDVDGRAGKVADAGVTRESGYLYYIDKNGDVSRSPMARGRK